MLTGTSEIHNNESLIERERLEGTPFYIQKVTEGYIITLQDFRLTEPKETPNKAIAELHANQWNVVTNMIIILHQLIAKQAADYLQQNKEQGPDGQ